MTDTTTTERSSCSGVVVGDDSSKSAIHRMARLIVVYTFVPCAIVAWMLTKSYGAVLVSFFVVPVWVFLQCSCSLLTYRWYYADAPTPLTPRHGVVVVHPNDKPAQPDEQQPAQKQQEEDRIPYETILNVADSVLKQQQEEERPIRLLLIGDSLAIGVGQTHWPTPIMPESIAKTLSKQLGGRAVYWTCHGEAGASLGWVIRELERGVKYKNKHRCHADDADDDNTEEESISTENSETDSSSDESSLDGGHNGGGSTQSAATAPPRKTLVVSDGLVGGGASHDAAREWRKRLRQHRERFEPDLQGYYDIAIVFTGPNDLKSCVMPSFLAKGEHFGTGAGGEARTFGRDLHRLLELLRRKMKVIFQHPQQHDGALSVSETKSQLSSTTQEEDSDRHRNRHPLVVLPGMPARMLPCFQHEPIRWYAPPAVDIMDMHKHDVAQQHKNDILYVPPPTVDLMTDYVVTSGRTIRHSEDVVLSLRDIPQRESTAQQQTMMSYYRGTTSAYMNNPFKTIRTRLFGIPPPIHLKAFAVDGIHPNELGYDFWGRYLGMAICEAWKQREINNNNIKQ